MLIRSVRIGVRYLLQDLDISAVIPAQAVAFPFFILCTMRCNVSRDVGIILSTVLTQMSSMTVIFSWTGSHAYLGSAFSFASVSKYSCHPSSIFSVERYCDVVCAFILTSWKKSFCWSVWASEILHISMCKTVHKPTNNTHFYAPAIIWQGALSVCFVRPSVPPMFVFSTPPTSLHGFEWKLGRDVAP